MNKMLFPALLVATVMVAGMFAFMPVEQASTVHTTVQDTQLVVKSVKSSTTAFSAADSATDTQTFTLDPSEAFVLKAIIVTLTDNDTTSDGSDKVDVTEVTVDGFALSLTDTTIGTTGATLAGTVHVSEIAQAAEIRGLADKVVVTIAAVNDGTNGGTITPNVVVDFVIEVQSNAITAVT